MRAVQPTTDGTVRLGELPDPQPGRGEVAVAIRATAINHADLLQLRGRYPPPPGESEVPGLECAGVIEALGEETGGWSVGDRVMALLAGGGHATRVVVPVGQLMALPEELDFVAGAALPEAGLTAWTNLVVEGELEAGETVLVTGATGGMGTMMVQLAHQLGARVVAVGRHRERLEALDELGAEARVLLAEGWAERVREVAGGEGVDLAVDLVGGEHLPEGLAALAPRGRLVLVGLLAGRSATLDLGVVLRHRIRLIGSVLRGRSRAEKARLVAAFAAFALPRLADGRLSARVDRVLPLPEIGQAYEALRAGGVTGKIVVEVG